MNATTTPVTQVTIVHVDAASEDGYDGTEGYVIEVGDEFFDSHETLDEAKRMAAAVTRTDAADWKRNASIDRNGFTTWTHCG